MNSCVVTQFLIDFLSFKDNPILDCIYVKQLQLTECEAKPHSLEKTEKTMAFNAIIQCHYKNCPLPKGAPIVFDRNHSIYRQFQKRVGEMKRKKTPPVSTINGGYFPMRGRLFSLGSQSGTQSTFEGHRPKVKSSKEGIFAVLVCGLHHDLSVNKYVAYIKEKYPAEVSSD